MGHGRHAFRVRINSWSRSMATDATRDPLFPMVPMLCRPSRLHIRSRIRCGHTEKQRGTEAMCSPSSHTQRRRWDASSGKT